MIESNKERQAPKIIEEAEPSHLIRYKFALNFITNNDIVLDAPCGSGYGTGLLSVNALKVYGIDIFKGAIDHAKELFLKNNNSFDVCDVQNLSLKFKDNDFFDKIISFEGIEHIKFPDDFLKEVKRTLKKNGLFIISTPRKPHGSPYHIIEFSLDEFKSILSKYFVIEDIYGQIYTDIFNLKEKDVDPFSYKRFNYIAICRKL